jgi:signal peptidase II
VSDAQTTPAVSAADGPRSLSPRRLMLCLIVAGVALVADAVSKIIVVATLSDRAAVRLAGGALYLTEARNPGAAFGLGASTGVATILFSAVAAVVVGAIIRTARRLHSAGWAVALGLVLGGALGNLMDRLTRAPGFGRGHVVDWISLFASDGSVWPIFNIADSAICCGAALAVLMALRGIEFDGRRTREREADDAKAAAAPSEAATSGATASAVEAASAAEAPVAGHPSADSSSSPSVTPELDTPLAGDLPGDESSTTAATGAHRTAAQND